MADDAASVLEREIRIEAQPETMFGFFTDPMQMVRWKGLNAYLDARPGGLYRVDINGHDVARGRVTARRGTARDSRLVVRSRRRVLYPSL